MVFSPVYLQKKCATDKKDETAKNIVKIGNFSPKLDFRILSRKIWIFMSEIVETREKMRKYRDFYEKRPNCVEQLGPKW